MDGLIGGFIFGLLGAFIKWIYLHIKCFFTRRPYKSFQEIYTGTKEDNDYDVVINSLSNQAVGLIFSLFIVFLILYLNL